MNTLRMTIIQEKESLISDCFFFGFSPVYINLDIYNIGDKFDAFLLNETPLSINLINEQKTIMDQIRDLILKEEKSLISRIKTRLKSLDQYDEFFTHSIPALIESNHPFPAKLTEDQCINQGWLP